MKFRPCLGVFQLSTGTFHRNRMSRCTATKHNDVYDVCMLFLSFLLCGTHSRMKPRLHVVVVPSNYEAPQPLLCWVNWQGLEGFFSLMLCCCVQTPVAITARAIRTGVRDLREALKSWVPWCVFELSRFFSSCIHSLAFPDTPRAHRARWACVQHRRRADTGTTQ